MTSVQASYDSRAHMTSAPPSRGRGYAYAVGAYTIWGLVPVYFKLVTRAAPLEVVSHRVLWAFVMLLAVGWRRDRYAELGRALRSRQARLGLSASTVLIAVNWLVYIWAVFGGRIVEASLGYFLTPLVSLLLGVLVLKERLELPVALALGMAGGGVLWLTLESGRAPWISIALALSFGSYGLVRKLVRNVGAVAGLTVESGLLSPLGIAYLAWAHAHAGLAFGAESPRLDVLLVLAGPVTAVPLLLFAGAVARLPLSSLSFLQYLSPSMQFVLAVAVYGEPFDAAQAGAFALIWLALVVFALHTLRRGAAEPVMEPD
jgi:chloramphenicol-sensitive protein RarD